jgi:uncharacterized protein (DUF433 family)
MTSFNEWRNRISIDPQIHHGRPCIKGTRVSVSVIVGSVAEGDSIDDVLRSYPQLSTDDVHAALLFAAEAVNRIGLASIEKAQDDRD